jgi:hypothetical protein
MARVRQERPVYERQADVILADLDLTYPRADESTTLFMEIAQVAPANHFRRV